MCALPLARSLRSRPLGEFGNNSGNQGASMKRRTFFKSTAAAGAAATAAPAIWSEAKAQARNETLLIVGESPPNSMAIHGVGANPPPYEAPCTTHHPPLPYA